MMTPEQNSESVSTLRNDIVALARRLRQSARADSETWTALMTLGAIERGDGQATPTVLATELGLRSSNLAQILGELDQRGLIKRSADQGDKRKVRLSLTDAGLDLLRETRTQRDQWLLDALNACLTAKERAQLIAAGALMRRLASSSLGAAGDRMGDPP
jgi:DNA-binding MarR family transcriptional regulator